jgi:anti-sigma-K factor RskA
MKVKIIKQYGEIMKRLIMLAVTCALTALLFACGGEKADKPEEAPAVVSEPAHEAAAEPAANEEAKAEEPKAEEPAAPAKE